MSNQKKQIGGPGYTGSFVVIEFKNGERKLIEGDVTHEYCSYYAQSYDNVKMVSGFEKNEPFEIAIEVSRYTNKW